MERSFEKFFMEAIRFEHWLRYHYMSDAAADIRNNEAEEAAAIIVPEAELARIAAEEPALLPLAESLNETLITSDSSRKAVFAFIQSYFGQSGEQFESAILKAVSDPDFRRALDAFHGFAQYCADGGEKDDDRPSYTEWMGRYSAWADEKSLPHITTIHKYAPDMDALKGAH